MDADMQQQYAEAFHGLHKTGDPLVLFNAWDAATAKAIAKTSPAIATSSGAVAAALGYADGEHVPLDMVAGLVSRITASVSVPVSIDLEAGLATPQTPPPHRQPEFCKPVPSASISKTGYPEESGNSRTPNSTPRRSRPCGTLRNNSAFIYSSMRGLIRSC